MAGLAILLNLMIAILAAYLNLWSPGESLTLQKVFFISPELGREVAHLFRYPKYAIALVSISSLALAVVLNKLKLAPRWIRLINIILNILCSCSIVFLAFI